MLNACVHTECMRVEMSACRPICMGMYVCVYVHVYVCMHVCMCVTFAI